MEGGPAEKETTEEKDGDDHHPAKKVVEEEEEKEGSNELRRQTSSSSSSSAGLSTIQDHLPIMHWEDLSLRIAELEKRERERREKAEGRKVMELWSVSGRGRQEECRGDLWRAPCDEEGEDTLRCRVAVVTSRSHNHKNLQLCFINNSESEEEEEGFNKKVATRTGSNGSHASGLKEEVAITLRTLRDKVLAEQREKERLAGSCVVTKWKHLELCEMRNCSIKQLRALRKSLQRHIHELSSELVSDLLVRDQLRTKQDAMLLDVQDLT